jgi:hypothetical protein
MVKKNADFALKGTLPLLASGTITFARIALVCREFRRRGIASLFLEGDAAAFHQDLQRSGAALARYLRSAPEEEKVASKFAGFFDAVACVDSGAARDIASQSPAAHRPEDEYEDDFLYVSFLMKRFFLNSAATELGGLLDHYRELLDGMADPRLDICESLLNGDGGKFDAALATLIEQRDAHYREAIEREQVIDEERATEGKLFVEGLALLRLATARGMPVQSDYLYIPSLAARSRAGRRDPDSWMDAFAARA